MDVPSAGLTAINRQTACAAGAPERLGFRQQRRSWQKRLTHVGSSPGVYIEASIRQPVKMRYDAPTSRDAPAEAGERRLGMRFGLLVLPAIPGTLEERKRLRPIAAHTERWQMMLKEIIEFARMA